MGIFDELAGVVENAVKSHPGGLGGVMNDALAHLGGLDGVVKELNQAGLGAQVNSWLGEGPNTPITADEIRSALTPEHLKQIAGKLGVPPNLVAEILAQRLPTAVSDHSQK
ncbi:MAG: YidB family protein [Devosia sp.]